VFQIANQLGNRRQTVVQNDTKIIHQPRITKDHGKIVASENRDKTVLSGRKVKMFGKHPVNRTLAKTI
jgi:light-regulated signal transduction histidine kinase (bacteriophytochrome)